MTRLRYLDPADGQYKFVPIGSSIEEVEVGPTQPTATPKPELWMDLTTPDPTGPQGGNALDQATADTLYLKLSGGTITGPLILAADPATALGTATRQYVDAKTGVRNRINNGDFSINQRGFTSSTTAMTWGFDRWFVDNSGGTVTHSAQVATLGDLPESSRNFVRLATTGQSAAGDYALLIQRIESVRTLSNKTVTVSFWARAASGTPKVAVEFLQNFGTGGSPSAQVTTYFGQATLSTTFTRYSVTGIVPSIAGKTVGTTTDGFLQPNFWTSAGSTFASRTGTLGTQTATIDFWGVQVEEGPYASAYEQKSLQMELAACQRYYHRIQQNPGGPTRNLPGVATSTTAWSGVLFLPVPMRAMPTLGLGGATLSLSDGTSYGMTSITPIVWPATSTGSANVSQIGVTNNGTGTGTLTQFRTYYMEWSTGTGAGYVDFNAEL